MKKRQNDPCKGCVWAKRISEGLIFCPFPRCVRGKLPPRAGAGRKPKRTIKVLLADEMDGYLKSAGTEGDHLLAQRSGITEAPYHDDF